MMRIPYSRQSIDESDIEAVSHVLRSDWLTQGPTVKNFEEAIAAYCQVDHAVAFSNASTALHAACMGLRLGKDDWFATSCVTFAASASCGLHCGASVRFCDVDPDTGLMDLKALDELCKKQGPPKIVIPVHLAGACPDMHALKGLSEQYGFSILEDASHALGAQYRSEPVGNCRYSTAAVFSLHPVKMITSGEGGLLVTNNADLATYARKFREHGISRDPAEWKNDTTHMGPWYYEVQELGYNYRLSDIHAALGLNQLKRLDSFVDKRREIHQYYTAKLDPSLWSLVSEHQDCKSSWHLCVAQLPPNTSEETYKSIFEALRAQGLYVNQHYIPLNRHPIFKPFSDNSSFPGADSWARRAISIPCHPGLTKEELHYSVDCLNSTARKSLDTRI
ncbi:MAG: UDP-4-amino-4,6-dideoxy-N-acetyl-beta-L-altrosamine transaminase [Opitutales bacterium]